MSQDAKENQVISELYGQKVINEGPFDAPAGGPSPRLTQDVHHSAEMMEVNDVSVSIQGNRLTIESHHGVVDVDLAPEQIGNLKEQWPSLSKQDKGVRPSNTL